MIKVSETNYLPVYLLHAHWKIEKSWWLVASSDEKAGLEKKNNCQVIENKIWKTYSIIRLIMGRKEWWDSKWISLREPEMNAVNHSNYARKLKLVVILESRLKFRGSTIKKSLILKPVCNTCAKFDARLGIFPTVVIDSYPHSYSTVPIDNKIKLFPLTVCYSVIQ